MTSRCSTFVTKTLLLQQTITMELTVERNPYRVVPKPKNFKDF